MLILAESRLETLATAIGLLCALVMINLMWRVYKAARAWQAIRPDWTEQNPDDPDFPKEVRTLMMPLVARFQEAGLTLRGVLLWRPLDNVHMYNAVLTEGTDLAYAVVCRVKLSQSWIATGFSELACEFEDGTELFTNNNSMTVPASTPKRQIWRFRSVQDPQCLLQVHGALRAQSASPAKNVQIPSGSWAAWYSDQTEKSMRAGASEPGIEISADGTRCRTRAWSAAKSVLAYLPPRSTLRRRRVAAIAACKLRELGFDPAFGSTWKAAAAHPPQTPSTIPPHGLDHQKLRINPDPPPR